MFRNRLYYSIKPFLPRSAGLALRSWSARRKRERVMDTWPIMPGSERPPTGWSGWPEGKQFALVLTHDVEGQAGLDQCRKLMELEIQLGFRSCFNFVPLGEYRVSCALRKELVANGFEVGVHDLYHNGKLFLTRREFSRNAPVINQYIADWGASGFRSGFMFHNLDWLHDLKIEYDSSTFDTDPFEPQPCGQHTIFPFPVHRPPAAFPGAKSRSSFSSHQTTLGTMSGYVELPYTLPQDSTLFLLLRERHPDIWFKKVDWIAKHGGMALIDTHPDYMAMDGKVAKEWQYPVSHYERFLEYVRSRYAGAYWHAKSKEVAQWHTAMRRAYEGNARGTTEREKPLAKRKAAVLLFSYYPGDARPRREAEVLAAKGMQVDLICLRERGTEAKEETINGVNVRRVPLRRRRDSRLNYILQYGSFISLCGALLAYRSLRRRYDLIHVHNMPDVLVFSALVPKLLGARIILDLHDPMPELMMTIFKLPEGSLAVRLLKFLEGLSMRFADKVITVNRACERLFHSRSCRKEKLHVLMNAPDENIFGFRRFQKSDKPSDDKPFVIMYHGSIVERNGLDRAVEAFLIARKTIPNAEFRIYGVSTDFLETVLASVRNKGVNGAIRYLGPLRMELVVKAIEECHVGIIPNRQSIFARINTPIRIFEYLSRGKPVIAPDTPGISDYFSSADLVMFELGSVEDMARKINYVYSCQEEVGEIVQRGQEIYLAHSWGRQKGGFVSLVGELLNVS